MGLNSDQTQGMAYGFSLAGNPNVGSWSGGNNVPLKLTDFGNVLAKYGGSSQRI